MSALKRFEDWPLRLDDAINDGRERTFEFGRHDCCLFVADCVKAMTGVDFAAEYRAQYGDQYAAADLLARHGGVEGFAQAGGGERLPTPNLAQRGDVVMVSTEHGPALAIVAGAYAFAAAPRGLSAVPMDRWLMAWRV